ncbi:MAG: coenzyme F420-0:L-glutamate ligase [Chloroflexota bacterium]
MTDRITVLPVEGIPEISQGDDLAALVAEAALQQGTPVASGDLVVVAQKAVSKSEGAIVDLASVVPSEAAHELAAETGKPPELAEVILSQTRRIVRNSRGVLIVETIHGLVCANAGVDQSNSGGEGIAITLPPAPDASARRIRRGLEAVAGGHVSVIVSDTFNRPWRLGSLNVAVGLSGFQPLLDEREQPDDSGRLLRATAVSIADELASAAQLVMGERGRRPAAIVRGARLTESEEASASWLLRDPGSDLFR